MGIRLEGMDDFMKSMEDKYNENKVREVVSQNTSEMFSEAQRTSPVDTGFMRRSHSMYLATDEIEGTVAVGAEYAVFVNSGTRYQDAQPWFTTAYNKQRPIFISNMRELFR